MIVDFFTNRMNLYVLLCLSYLIIGYLCSAAGLTTTQLTIVCFVIGIGNGVSYLFGYEKGIQFALTKRPNFVKELDKLNELTRKDNKSNTKGSSKCKSNKCKKC